MQRRYHLLIISKFYSIANLIKQSELLKRSMILFVCGSCLFSCKLYAWQRTALRECEKKSYLCKKDPVKCKKELLYCQQVAFVEDEADFVNQLTQYHLQKFKLFNANQKDQAMSFADGNRMTPDAAVDKVGSFKDRMYR